MRSYSLAASWRAIVQPTTVVGMAQLTVKNEPTTTSGELPATGEQLPAFDLVGSDLAPVTAADFAGRRLVLNIFPSVDTGVCAASVRAFNKLAAELDNTTVLCVSQDLPFAQQRFCAAEGIDNVVVASAFRSSFGEDYGLRLEGSPLKGLLARAVVITDDNHNVIYTQLVPETGNEPDYEAAKAALNGQGN